MGTILTQFIPYLEKRRSPYTVSAYRSITTAFLKDTGGSWEKSKVLSFLEGLGSPSYFRLGYYALRKLARFEEAVFPLTEEDLIPLPEDKEIHRPALSVEDMEKVIHGVKKWGSPAQQFYFALATTYGFRREELRSIDPKSIEDRVVVQTRKKGRVRTHAIPVEVAPYIHGQVRRYSSPGLGLLYKRVLDSAGVKAQPRDGFHSVRRALDRELIRAGVPIFFITQFFGWTAKATGGVLGMPGYYGVGVSDEEVDKQIFDKHPFLSFWT